MKIKPSKIENEMERAIIMLIDCIKENCLNPKPLIMHSLRVGFKLQGLNQPKETIIAGILHDLVEDTNCTLPQIKKEFGPRVANLVYALTQEKIEDYKERWYILLKKIKKAGRAAMVIKIVDMNDNLIHYIPLIKDKEYLTIQLWKCQFTIKSLKPYIGELEIFQKLENNVKAIKNARKK